MCLLELPETSLEEIHAQKTLPIRKPMVVSRQIPYLIKATTPISFSDPLSILASFVSHGNQAQSTVTFPRQRTEASYSCLSFQALGSQMEENYLSPIHP